VFNFGGYVLVGDVAEMKFSPSLMKSFQSCNLRYKLAKDHPDTIEPQSAAASYGTLVHKCIEMHLLGRPIEDTLEFFNTVWTNPEVMGIVPDYYPARTSHGSYRKKGSEAILGFYEEHRWLDRELLATEFRFCFPYGSHFISGIIDVLEYDPTTDTLYIIDLKTGARPNADNLRFDLQFLSYDLAVQQKEFWCGYEPEIEKYTGFSNGEGLFDRFRDSTRETVWYDLRNAKEYVVGKHAQRDYDRLLMLCDQIEKAIELDVFVPNITGDSCKWCAFTDICPSFVEEK